MEMSIIAKEDISNDRQNHSSLISKNVSFPFKQNSNQDRSRQGETEKNDGQSIIATDQKITMLDGGDMFLSNMRRSAKLPVSQQNTITMQLTDIVKRVKLRQAASKLINSTRLRMQKNMKPHQYAFINDKAQDFTDLKKKPFVKSLFSLNLNRSQNKVVILKGIQILFKLMKMIPVINPANGWKYFWDTFISLSLIYSFFIIPVMVCFGIQESDVSYGNILEIILLINIMDILVLCNTGFYKRGVLCKNRTSIWKKYYNEQMRADFMSLLPIAIYRILSMNLLEYQNYYQFITLSILIKWKAIQKLYDNTQQKYILKPNTRNIMKLLNLFFKILLIAHGCACFWVTAGRISEVYYNENWMLFKKLQNASWDRQYLSAFYFCCVTMTTVGYGDIYPQSAVEILFCIVILLFACGVFGFSINTIQTILTDFSKDENEIMEKMFIIKNYLNKKSINQNLSKDVTEYLEYYWRANQQSNITEEDKMINQLPDSLRNDLLIESNRLVLRDCQIFQNNFSEEVINATIPIIKERNFTPSEVIYAENEENLERAIYFVQEGVVELYMDITNQQGPPSTLRSFKTIKRFKKGDCFGEIEFFTNNNRTKNVRSVSFSTLLKIDRKDFIETIKKFPLDYEQFCYIKDRLMLQHDYSKINHKCISCQSETHRLELCPYLHFIPNKPKLVALVHRSSKQKRNEIPIEKQRQRIRQRYRLLPQQVGQVAELYQNDKDECIEEYTNKYLSFDISKCDICTNLVNLNPVNNQQYVNMNSNQIVNPIQHQYTLFNKQKTNNEQPSNNPVYSNNNTFYYQRQGNSMGNQQNNKLQQQSNFNNISMYSNQKNDEFHNQKINLIKQNYGRGVSKNTASIMEDTENEEIFSPKALKIQKYPSQNGGNFTNPSQLGGGQESEIKEIMSPQNRGKNKSVCSVIQLNQNMNNSFHNNNNTPSARNINTSNQDLERNQQQQELNLRKLSIMYTYNDIMNIYQSQNSVNNFHQKQLFFDVFCGEFEKMKMYEFYYPLHNYAYMIKQLHMDSDQKKRLKNKLLEQQRQNMNKIMMKKKKKLGPRGSINQSNGDHTTAIKRLVDKFEQDNTRDVKNMTLPTQTLQATNTNIYVNNPNHNSMNLSPSIHNQRQSFTFTMTNGKSIPSQQVVQKPPNDLESDHENNSKQHINVNKSNVFSKLGAGGLNASISGSIAESQSSSDIFNIYGQNQSNSVSHANNDESVDKSNQYGILQQNLFKSVGSSKNMKKRVSVELEKFLESQLSPPYKEKSALNYEHSEIPEIRMTQYNNQLDRFSSK